MSPRGRATIRTSISAARQLLSRTSILKFRAEQEILALEGFQLFFAKKYQEALDVFEGILKSGAVSQVSEARHWLLLEYAAASAVVLGRNSDAHQFFSAIPTRARTAETRLAMSYLQETRTPEIQA